MYLVMLLARTRWGTQVARMMNNSNACRASLGSLKKLIHMKDLRLDGRIILKVNLN
jgi:hypothetical protein